MAAVSKKKAVVKLDILAGTPTDISSTVQTVDLNVTNAVGKFGALGTIFKTALEGIKDWSVTMTVVINTTTDTASDLLKEWIMATTPGERTILIGFPDATTTGSVTWTGEVMVESVRAVNADYNSADVQTMDVTLQGSGTLTDAIVV